MLYSSSHIAAHSSDSSMMQADQPLFTGSVSTCLAGGLAWYVWCRLINTQRFIEFTRDDLQRRQKKYEDALAALEPKRKQLSPEDADKFFERLMEDTMRRKRNQ